MEILLRHASGAHFTAEARHHRVSLDQPMEDGATDQGLSPAELLLASLGGCVGQVVAQYMTARGIPSDGLSIRVCAEPAAQPLQIGNFHVEIAAPALDDRQLRGLLKAVPAGLVQNAIRFEHSIRITASPSKPGKGSKKS